MPNDKPIRTIIAECTPDARGKIGLVWTARLENEDSDGIEYPDMMDAVNALHKSIGPADGEGFLVIPTPKVKIPPMKIKWNADRLRFFEET